MQNLVQFREEWKRAYMDDAFRRQLHQRGTAAEWARGDFYTRFFPMRQRLDCREAVERAGEQLMAVTVPEEGWPSFVLQFGIARLYENHARPCTPAQEDFALCALRALSLLLTAERENLPFDPAFDFAFCTPAEREGYAAVYNRFLTAWQEGYLYEVMRLSGELTPFSTLPHIAGVHHVAMTVARELKVSGEALDLALVSAAAAGHDVGKFGCMPGERVPYLHYYYTDRWFERIGLPEIGQIAANHSTWDLELENLTTESMLLIYADFRMKQQRLPDGREESACYTLDDAFDVILNKLDNVDAAKRRRYEYVYRKLHDFEEYLRSRGVDTTLSGHPRTPEKPRDIALMKPEDYYRMFRLMAVEHNLNMMHRFSREQLFANVLEQARSEKDWTRLRTYLCILEVYFTYLSGNQKMQALRFLYELLLHKEGDIRRQAAGLMGQMIARFSLRYKKELPSAAGVEEIDRTQFALWAQYLNLLIYPERKLTPQQRSHIHFTAKLVVSAVLENSGTADSLAFMEGLMPYYAQETEDEEAALALTDTLSYLPIAALTPEQLDTVIDFAGVQSRRGNLSLTAAALRFFCRAAEELPVGHAVTAHLRAVVEASGEHSVPALRYLSAYFRESLGLSQGFALGREEVADIFVDNLKTATPWLVKLVNIELLTRQAAYDRDGNIMHIAAHFSNLIKVSEAIVVRKSAGDALLATVPHLTFDQRNEVAVELAKGLEVGQHEFSKYIPQYLGELLLYLRPTELDETLDYLQELLSHANASVAASSLDTVGQVLEHYRDYADRYPETPETWRARRRLMYGMLLKGMASYRQTVQQEALFVISNLFSSEDFSTEEKAWFFTLCAHKMLFLLCEQPERGLNYLYCSAALYHIYRFLIHYEVDYGGFTFHDRKKVAFFPGTFDPFTLSHKGIVRAIRDMGFEVYLAIDEFSWSKKAQPGLLRRQMASMSVADEFHVYLFPHDVPVNLASPADLDRLRSLFPERELYLTVGSDVISGASSYRQAPVPGSVHSMNHIVFLRVSDQHGESGAAAPDFSDITGDVITLQLPPELEDISSTRIRENIDLNRDISHLIDPVVQEFIYQRGLYLREPQYKPLMEAGTLHFVREEHPSRELLREAFADQPDKRAAAAVLERGDSVLLLRARNEGNRVLGLAAWRYVRLPELYHLLQNVEQVNRVRDVASGKILCLTGLYATTEEVMQLLLTELFTQAMADDCVYALHIRHDTQALVTDTLRCQGFCPVDPAGGDESLMLVDMNSPVVFLQNVETAVKAPFSNDPTVIATIRACRQKLKMALVGMYPGKLILTVSAQMIHHRLVEKITELNHVPMAPTYPRTLGPYMCVPFGKLLRGNAVPNTVTKTIHTDKVFAPDLLSQWIEAFPYYAPLADQMRTVKSFDRPVILVDDQLHTGRRIRVLDPLARAQGVEIREVLVGILSGQGRDLMEQWGRTVDCVYFVPNLRAWYVESTMYPFIGGDTVRRERRPQQGLQPSVNMILPYTYPEHLKRCGAAAAYGLSRACLENTFHIMTVLEAAYRRTYARNLTLRRLGEVIVLPLCPDKGNLLYDLGQAVSAYLQNDLASLERMRNLFEG
ncbi:MAG: cytidyltransferase-related domain protein [Oscillibacter sp.]|nr:cytidyltransferase-related domain protein [Oscillibacter sp.]